jgi:hypothetical protein
MDPKGKRMVINDKEKESLFNELRDDKPTYSGSSHRKRVPHPVLEGKPNANHVRARISNSHTQ